MRHILINMLFNCCRSFSELITVKLTAKKLHILLSATGFAMHFIIASSYSFEYMLMLLEAISRVSKPENSQIRPSKHEAHYWEYS